MAYGHVMEFIDGEQGGTVNLSVKEDPPESLRRLVRRINGVQTLCCHIHIVQIDYTMSTLVTINQLGVTYNDVKKQNILYRKNDTRHPFVFIDFGSAEPSAAQIVAYDCFL